MSKDRHRDWLRVVHEGKVWKMSNKMKRNEGMVRNSIDQARRDSIAYVDLCHPPARGLPVRLPYFWEQYLLRSPVSAIEQVNSCVELERRVLSTRICLLRLVEVRVRLTLLLAR